MKKHIRFIIAVMIVTLVIGLLIWRFLPRSSAHLMSVNESSVTCVSALATVNRLDNGSPHTDTYRIDSTQQQGALLGELIDILATSRYRSDFRNLLPWELASLSAGKNYDGRTVSLVFSAENQTEEYIYIRFLSSSLVSVHIGNESGFRIYHPANRETLDKLVEYLQTNGLKQ